MVLLLWCSVVVQPFKVVTCSWLSIRCSPDGYIEVHRGILQGDRCLYYSHPSVSDGCIWQTISGCASHTIFYLWLPYYKNYLQRVIKIDTLIQEW